MKEPGEIQVLNAGTELHTCPACGYALGFHTSFINAGSDKNNPVKSTREVYKVILICPECGARYDVGWRVSFTEFESKFVKTPVKPVVSQKAGKLSDAPRVTAVACLPPAEENHVEPPQD